MPENILLFYRNKKLIEDQLREVNLYFPSTEGKRLTDVEIYEKVIKKNICSDLWWTAGEAQNDAEAFFYHQLLFA